MLGKITVQFDTATNALMVKCSVPMPGPDVALILSQVVSNLLAQYSQAKSLMIDPARSGGLKSEVGN